MLHRRRFLRDIRSAVLMGAAAMAWTPSAALAMAPAQSAFDIEEQSLATALNLIGRRTKAEIIFNPSVVVGKHAPALRGNYTVEGAISRVIAGSGLQVRRTGQGVFIVEPIRSAAYVPVTAAVQDTSSTTPIADPERSDEEGQSDDEPGEVIVVTGSSIRGAPAVGSNLISVGRETIEDNAVQTVQQLLQTVPAVWGSNASTQGAFGSFDASGLQVPQIHGIGGANSSSTLVVIDGHRFPLGGVRRNLPDPNFIPPNSIERVEVLAEGASSIYGSDAVAGVMNFITRNRFEGMEASAQFGVGDEYKTWSATLSLGHRWESGGAAVFYSYSDRGGLHGADRPLTLPDQRARGGSNFGNFNCAPASLQPAGQTRIFLYPYTQPSVANNQTDAPCEQASLGVLIPKELRHSLMVKLDQEVGERLRLKGDVVYSDRRNISQGGVGNNIQATVFGPGSGRGGQINPFYTNPLGSTATSQTIRFNANDLLPRGSRSVSGIEIFYGFGSAEYKLSENWRMTGFVMAGVSQNSEVNTGFLCSSCLLLALNGTTNSNGNLAQPSIPNTNILVTNTPLTTANAIDVWNPLSSNRTSSQVLQRLQDSRNHQRVRQVIQQYNLKLDGTLFRWRAGDVKVAVGGDILKQSVDSEVVESNNTGPSSISSSYNAFLYGRTVKSAFSELLLPLISGDMSVPFVHSLTLNVSGRYDHYSDFGNIWNPKLGANWEVMDGLKLRANYAEAFVAPQFSTYGPDQLSGLLGRSIDTFFGPSTGTITVPLDRYPEARGIPACSAPGLMQCVIGTAAVPGMRLQGASEDVRPTQGKSWAVGADFNPSAMPGLRASLTYWHTSLIGAVGGPQPSIIVNTAVLHDLIRIYPNGATPAEIEAYRDGIRQNAPLASGPIYFGLDSRNRNIYTVFVEGIDFDLHYRHRFPWGSIRGGVAGTYKTKFDQTAGPGETVFSVLNRNAFNSTFPTNRLDARADFGIDVGNLRASVAANHTGSYIYWGSNAINPLETVNGVPVGGGDKVRSYTTVSMNVSYDFENLFDGKLTAFIDVDNLFDAYPPFVNTANGFDALLAFPMGRVVNMGLRAKF